MLKKSIAKDNKQTWQLAYMIHQELDSRRELLKTVSELDSWLT